MQPKIMPSLVVFVIAGVADAREPEASPRVTVCELVSDEPATGNGGDA